MWEMWRILIAGVRRGDEQPTLHIHRLVNFPLLLLYTADVGRSRVKVTHYCSIVKVLEDDIMLVFAL